MWIQARASDESQVTHQSNSRGDPNQAPIPELLSMVISMDGPSVEKNGTTGNYFPFNLQCYSHQIRLVKHPERIRIIETITSERIRITEIVTSALMMGFFT